jgi:hypothetical protein
MQAHHRLTGDQALAFTAGTEELRSVSVHRSLPKTALNLRLEEFQHFEHGGALHHVTVAVVFSLVTRRPSARNDRTAVNIDCPL